MSCSRWTFTAIGLSGALLIGGCPQPDSMKTMNFAVYGEEFIEDLIPSEETDGWEIRFTRFLINLGGVRVQRGGVLLGQTSEFRIYDLTQDSGGDGFSVATLQARARSGVHEIRYMIAPAGGDSAAGNASSADTAFMNANGHAVYVEFEATRGAEQKSAAWGFGFAADYTGCFTTLDFTESDETRIELTIHGDHFFYAGVEDDTLRFDAMAGADADDDGVITLAELAAVAVDPSTGGDNLRSLVEALVATLGHIDGEGHCIEVISP